MDHNMDPQSILKFICVCLCITQCKFGDLFYNHSFSFFKFSKFRLCYSHTISMLPFSTFITTDHLLIQMMGKGTNASRTSLHAPISRLVRFLNSVNIYGL